MTSMRAVVVTALSLVLGACGASVDPESDGSAGPTDGGVEVELPPLASFRAEPSDQFLVDLESMDGGHPFKGRRAAEPHSGAHVHFATGSPSWPAEGSAPTSYPAIYAVADGVVTWVDATKNVGTNDRYGVTITIARDGDLEWNFDYSIEPMVPEPSPGFYARFITVKQGDVVRKGQVIAYMYAPPRTNGTHIHFELMDGSNGSFMAPAIFSAELVGQFAARWAEFGRDGPGGSGPQMLPCMGWMLDASENPFDDGATDCL